MFSHVLSFLTASVRVFSFHGIFNTRIIAKISIKTPQVCSESSPGAGKTYTLAGQRSSKQPGIQDLAIGDLLRLAKESFEVRLTALEIYNESIQDESP